MIWHYTCHHCQTEGYTATRKPTCSNCGRDVIPRPEHAEIQKEAQITEWSKNDDA